jgi:spermidine synthase
VLGDRALGKDRFAAGLRVQVFVSGFVVIALELLGSRLITPVFGNSTTTWGSLIGVVLAGLAAGYHVGGKLADRSPVPGKFSAIVFSGGILVVLLPFVSPFALGVPLSLGLGDRYGPILASVLILSPPTFALGMVSPYAIRVKADTLVSLGKVAGNLYSLSTIGSILGAFSTVFVLMPLLDVRSIIFSMGVALMLISLIWLPRISVAVVAVVILILFTSFIGVLTLITTGSGSVVYEKDTSYSHLNVVDTGGQRTLFLDGQPQSSMYLDNPTRLVYAYTTYFDLGPLINPGLRNVLFVGGGGFSGQKYFLTTYPQVHVDVTEIDPDVIQTAQQFFGVAPNPRLTIFNEDARLYLTESSKTYDLIVLDAYAKTYVPFHLLTEEFMNLVYSHLSSNGVVITNLIGSLVGDTSDLVRAEYKTASTFFPNTAVFTTTKVAGYVQNVILVFDKSAVQPLSDLLKNSSMSVNSNSGPLASDFRSYLYQGQISVDDVPLLTDNYAPVESLLNPVTGKPYIIEQQVGRLAPVTDNGNYLLSLILLVGVAMAWFVVIARRVQ